MKGVILAGGSGSRLWPLTAAVNKHLLPLGSKPMICRAIDTMVECGIAEIAVVTNDTHVWPFAALLESSIEYNLVVKSIIGQQRPGGIAEAIGCAEDFAEGEEVMVLLADNVYERSLKPWVDSADCDELLPVQGASVLLTRPDPSVLSEVGVAVMNDESRITRIVEKPDEPLSGYAVTGAYIFDERVWGIIPKLQRSLRGELEVTSILDVYARWHDLSYEVIAGFWMDAGQSIEAYYEACDFVRNQENGRSWVGSSTSAASRATTSSSITPSRSASRA